MSDMTVYMQTIAIFLGIFLVGQFLVIKLALLSLHKKIRKIVSEELIILYYLIVDDGKDDG